MKYTPIDSVLFSQNREKLSKKLIGSSAAIFQSNDIYPSNGDGTLPFFQNDNLYYLSGIDQEETVLVLCPEHPKKEYREVLFIKETNEMIAIWEGHKYTKEEARKASGVDTILWTHEFEQTLTSILNEVENIYLDANEHNRASTDVNTKTDRFTHWCKRQYPLHTYRRVAPLLTSLRMIKSSLEIATIQKACDITNDGFRRVLKFIKPNQFEYEVEAEFIHEFIRRGSNGFAYSPIVAGGANACVLHYIDNNSQLKNGDTILMDIGASYAQYNADMTRVVPVSGRFSERQKAVYNAVLEVKKAAEQLLRPEVTLQQFTKEVVKVMEAQLIGLKLLDKTDIKNQSGSSPAYRKYFMHGVSHHLGIGVHDVADSYASIQENMVFTIEPGIYIREENIGMRLEDNYVVGKNRNQNLMQNIPIEIDEIESLMND